MKRRGGIVIAFVAIVAVALASTAGAGSSAAAKTQAVSCKSTLTLAFMGPLTGDAGFIGTEQLLWFKYAVKTLPAKYGLKIKGVSGDTQLDNQIASSLAQKYIADKSVVAIIGPSTSGAVAATSKTFFQAGMAHISGSATNTNLTKKDPAVLATPAFFRVVPDDGIQGPADARYRIEKLKAKVRARGEHAFRVVKRQFGYVKVRYRGLAKNTAQLHMLFALANIWRVRRRLLAPG